ncbi:hypothetical protein C8R46DRAFT_1209317 [Mycena filopes]|nr:hypothetical protein C8R46DRAFT_1209317 [Mycena filopes]
MNANFTFPARQPIPRPPPPAQTEPINRESNALRASVLDAALELGFGANGAVANWMFNNTLEEEDEDVEEDPIGRGPLSATSDEYAPGVYSTPPTSIESHSESYHPTPSPTPNPATPPQIHFPPVPAPAVPSGNKLRKQRRDGGYESDGGYVSDGGKKARARTKSKPKDPSPAPPISEPMELIPLTKEERKKKKKEKPGKGSKDHGAETDTEDIPKLAKSKSSKKAKKPSADAGTGYETDDGYASSKPKGRSRFFSLRRKGDSTSESPIEPVPPMPEPPREVFQLPIASRFATTLAPDEGSASPSVTPSRAATPLLPPSRPFASGSSSPSSSSLNSLLTPADQDTFGSGSLSINSGGARPDEDSLRSAIEKNATNRMVTFAASHESIPASPQPSPNATAPKSKFFNISYPLTRNEPADAKVRPVPSPISLSPNTASGGGASRAASPMGSPYVLLTPINTSMAQPPPPRALSPSGYTDFEPSNDYIVPSRSGSPLPPSPNVLAYYDVPPPSPPPNAPLPRAPRAPPSAARDPTPGVARLRGLSQDRAGGRLDVSSPLLERGARLEVASPMSMSGRSSPRPVSPGGGGGMMSPITPGGGGVQRGRAAPFPSQPLSGTRTTAGMGPGLAARAKVERYRDLYAIQIPATPQSAGARRGGYPYPAEDEYDGDEVGIRVEGYSDEEEDGGEEEILGVLGRFQDQDARERAARRVGNALERNNSGALRPGTVNPRGRAPSPSRWPGGGLSPTAGGGDEAYSDDDEASRYPDDDKTAGRSTMYRVENGGGRDTIRWSDDYSTRASFMDVDRSEQARGQLVQRVGTIFDLSGRERNVVPPVPKLPAGLLAAGPGGNRF